MIICECGRKFSNNGHLKLHKKTCKGPLYCQNPECKKLLINGQLKFCSSICSAKITTKGRKHTLETRQKISKSLGGKGNIIIKEKCLNCNNKTLNPKFCCFTCSCEFKYNNSINDWLVNYHKYKSPRQFMKTYFIKRDGEKCIRCGWNKRNIFTNRIPLELHHEDGDWTNNDPKNLYLICPNCHSLTETYRYGNKGKGREVQREYYRGKTNKK